MTVNLQKFVKGDRVRIANTVGNARYAEATGTVREVTSNKSTHPYYIDFDDAALSSAGAWSAEVLELNADPVIPPARIRATLPSDTAKAYAGKARSRLLSEPFNEVLTDAADGREIDVVQFRKAVTAALSLAATRAGQSMARRTWTKEARHLIYWADAIIDQHVLGLPIYEAGARSPRITELKAEVERLRAEGSPAVSKALRDAKDALDHQKRQIDSISGAFRQYKSVADAEVTRLNEIVGGATKALAEVEGERDTIASVLAYVVQHGDPLLVSRVLGYWDGLEDA